MAGSNTLDGPVASTFAPRERRGEEDRHSETVRYPSVCVGRLLGKWPGADGSQLVRKFLDATTKTWPNVTGIYFQRLA